MFCAAQAGLTTCICVLATHIGDRETVTDEWVGEGVLPKLLQSAQQMMESVSAAAHYKVSRCMREAGYYRWGIVKRGPVRDQDASAYDRDCCGFIEA